MSLADLLAPERAAKRQNPLEAIVPDLEGEEREALVAALNNSAFTNAQISDALQSVGYEVDNKQVYWYRKKYRLGQFAPTLNENAEVIEEDG